MARFKAMEIQIRLKLRLRRYSQVRDARRARYGLASVADRGSLMSGDRSFSAPNQPLVRNGHSSSSSSSSERRGSKRGTHMLALSSSPYRALAVISGSVIDVEMTQNLPPSVHLTGPIRVNDGISSGDDARPRAQLPAKLLHWIEGTDRTQVRLTLYDIFVRRLCLRMHLVEHLISSSTTLVVFLYLSEPLFSAYAGFLMGGTLYHQRQREHKQGQR